MPSRNRHRLLQRSPAPSPIERGSTSTLDPDPSFLTLFAFALPATREPVDLATPSSAGHLCPRTSPAAAASDARSTSRNQSRRPEGMMKRESQTMDPRSLLAPSAPSSGSSSFASRQHAAYTRGSSRPTGRTVYDTSPAHSSHPLAPPPISSGEQSYFASQSYSTSAPSGSSALFTPPLPPNTHAPSTAPPQVSPQLAAGNGGKVRKGKDRAARPVLGLRVKSEDGLVDGQGIKVRAQYSACGCVAARVHRILSTRFPMY